MLKTHVSGLQLNCLPARQPQGAHQNAAELAIQMIRLPATQ
jgi:hypothetical protein